MPLNKKPMNLANIEYLNLEELSKADYKIVSGEADITGWPVRDESGANVGRVRELLFDPEQKAIRYIVVDLDPAIAGIEEKATLIPIGFANLGTDKKEVVLPVMDQTQFEQMPQYIIGEVTAETEMKIRSAIGSPAALRIEEDIVELNQEQFDDHHQFDRGNEFVSKPETHYEQKPTEELFNPRSEETKIIHEIIERSDAKPIASHHDQASSVSQGKTFELDTTDGRFTIIPENNGNYRVLNGEQTIGVVYQESGELDKQWRAVDELGNRFVTMIGAAITAHNSSAVHH